MGDDAPEVDKPNGKKSDEAGNTDTGETITSTATEVLLSEDQFFTMFAGLFFMTEVATNMILASKAKMTGETALRFTTIQVTEKREPDARALCAELYKQVSKPTSMFHWMVNRKNEYLVLATLTGNFIGGIAKDVQAEIIEQTATDVTPKPEAKKKEEAA